MSPEVLNRSDVPEPIHGEEISKSVKAVLFETRVRLQAEMKRHLIQAYRSKVKVQNLQAEIDHVNVIIRDLSYSHQNVDPDPTRLQANSRLGDSSEGRDEHVTGPGIVPGSRGLQQEVTWQVRPGHLELGQSAPERLSPVPGVDASSSDEEAYRLRRRPSSARQTNSNLTHQHSEKWRKEPMIISNDFSEADEILKLVRFHTVNPRSGAKLSWDAFRDSGAECNAASESFARESGGLILDDDMPLPEVKPFGGRDYLIKPKFRFWALLDFPTVDRLCWIEFYAFDDEIMEENEVMLSIKTCLKTGLPLMG